MSVNSSAPIPGAERFKSFYRRSFLPDAAFFQTLTMNSANQGEVVMLTASG